MQVISSGGIPLALALGVRGIRLAPAGVARSRRWLVAAWQLSLGFALGLPVRLPARRCSIAIGAVVWSAPRAPAARRAGS